MKAGDQLHTFTILEVLGHGGMGGVFVGENSENGELVAIKTLFEEFSKDEAYVRRFQREASVYRKLNHPNIVRCIASGFDKGVYFIAMEHIKGKSLDEKIKEEGHFNTDYSLQVMDALSGAVYHAHSRGVIHRDLKPQNIMINEQGIVKLLDFGVAQADDDLVKTASGSIVGTFFYSSPEQNQGQKIDERSDLYSLGLVFYEMLLGRRALNGATLLEVSSLQMQGRIDPPSSINSDIDTVIDRIVMKLLERDPNQRFQSARDLQNELKSAMGSDSSANSKGGIEDSLDKEISAKWSQAKEAFARRDLDKAMKLAIDVSRSKTEDAEIHCLLGKIYAAKEYTYNAIEEFKKTMALEPSSCQYKLDFAVALYSMKMIERSREEFKKVLEIDPNNPFAQQYLQLIDETENEANPSLSKKTKSNAPLASEEGFEKGIIPPPRKESNNSSGVISPPKPYKSESTFQRSSSQTEANKRFIPAPGSSSANLRSFKDSDFVQNDSKPRVIPPPGRSSTGNNSTIPPPGSSFQSNSGVIPPPNKEVVEDTSVTDSEPPSPVYETPLQAPSGSSVIPPPHRNNRLPQQNEQSFSSDEKSSDQRVTPSNVNAYIAPPINSYSSQELGSKNARDGVLGRNQQPKAFQMNQSFSSPQNAPRASARFQSKARSENAKREMETLKPPLNPAKAKFVAYFWWGGGHFYNGQKQRGFTWTIIQAFILLIILWPLTSQIVPASNYWKNPTLDIGSLVRSLEGVDSYYLQRYVLKSLDALAGSDLNLALRKYSKKYMDLFLISIGCLIYLLYTFKIPKQIHRYAVLSNLTGKVIEVRRDLSIKINMGEERGVQVGQVFSIQKRKHLDEVQALNFKTMMMAPKMFSIGEAKVVSTTLHFAICKFRRLPGETSNPSIGDKVILKKSLE
mgnify:FL=1